MAFQEETWYYCIIRKYVVKLLVLNSESRRIDNNKTVICTGECFSKNFSCAFWFDLVHSRNITSLNSSSARGRNEKLAFETFVSKATYAGTMETAPKFLFVKRSAIMSLSTQFTNPTSIGRLGMWQARIQHAMWRQDYKTRFSWDNKHRFARFQQTYWMRLNRVLDNNIDHLVLPNWFKTNVILRSITIERRRKNCRWQLGKNV